jgi:hypothetical protein
MRFKNPFRDFKLHSIQRAGQISFSVLKIVVKIRGGIEGNI